MRRSKNAPTRFLLVLGIITAAFVGFSVAMGFMSTGAFEALGKSIAISDYFSLIGGLLGASFTVAVTVFVTKAQIDAQKYLADENRRQEEEYARSRREEELNAAKAIFALDLSIISNYLEACINHSVDIKNRVANGSERLTGIPSTIDVSTLLRVARLISLSPAQSANVISKLLNDIQVHHSRYVARVEDYKGDGRGARRGAIITERSFDFVFSYSIAIHMQVSNLFSFARRDLQNIAYAEFTPNDFSAALNILGLVPLYFGEELDRMRDNVKFILMQKNT